MLSLQFGPSVAFVEGYQRFPNPGVSGHGGGSRHFRGRGSGRGCGSGAADREAKTFEVAFLQAAQRLGYTSGELVSGEVETFQGGEAAQFWRYRPGQTDYG